MGAWTRARALSTVRARCGCIKRTEARAIGDDAAREVAEQTAEDFAADWRCPAAGYAPGPLPRELDALQRSAARVMGTDPPGTCPFACVMRADPYVAELTRALAIAEKYHTPLPAVLGRDLTPIDLDAADAVIRAHADVWESDQQILDAQREAGRKSPPRE